jgi:Ca2+/Na+ antiporter
MGQPISRNTVKKALVVIACLAAAIIVTKLYLKTIGILILAAIFVYALLSLTTKKEKNTPSGAAGKSDKIPLGKAVQFLQYLIYGLIVVAIIRLLIGQPK